MQPTGWKNQIRILNQEPEIPTTERTVAPSRPGADSHLPRAVVLADTNGNRRAQCRGCVELQLGAQCSERQEHKCLFPHVSWGLGAP